MFAGRVTVGGEVVRDPAARRRPSRTRSRSTASRSARPRGRARSTSSTSPPASSRPRTTPTAARTIVDLVKGDRRLYPVGRLDADTTGLILLTDDGELAYRLTHPSFEVPKVYRAVVRNPPVREPALRRLREGVELEDGRTSPAKVRRIAPGELELTIHEGRKRQVRRMLEAVGHRVETLERVAFGPLRLGNAAARRPPPPDRGRGRAAAQPARAAAARAAD